MRKSWCGRLVFCTVAAISGCRAPSQDWNGTWKMNPSKGNFEGPRFTISLSADGEYRYDDGNSNVTFRCDGKDRPTEKKNRTRSCVKSSATALNLTRKENGARTNASHWELSADGKTLAFTATEFRPSGPVVASQMVASRISGSNDFAGQWRDETYLSDMLI